MSSHAKLSPSAADRWGTCAGSVEPCANAPDTGSDYADAGTAGHEVASCMLEGKKTPKVATNGLKVTPEMVDLVTPSVKFVLDYKKKHKAKIFSEKKVQIGEVAFGLDPSILWGTADVVAIAEHEVAIMDFKLGYTEVEADSTQLKLYCLGVAYETGWVHDQYRLVILQPASSRPVKEHVMSGKDLEDFEMRWRPKVKAALKGGAFVPSEKGCRWCKIAATCPALHEEQVALAQREFADPIQVSVDQIAKVLDQKKRVEDFLAAVERHAMKLIELGQEVPGYKLVQGKKHRAWRDPKAVEAKLKKMKGVDADDYAPRKLATPAQIEKLIGKEFTAEHAFTPEGPPTLVPVADPRPALPAAFTKEDAACG